MKNRSRLVGYAVPLAALAALGMYVWTGFVSLMVIGLAAGILAALRMWSHRCAQRRSACVDSIVKLALSAYSSADKSHAERKHTLDVAVLIDKHPPQPYPGASLPVTKLDQPALALENFGR